MSVEEVMHNLHMLNMGIPCLAKKIISSIYITIICPRCGLKISLIIFMNIDGELLRLNGITSHSYISNLVLKVFLMHHMN
jgi:hypothetical protein